MNSLRLRVRKNQQKNAFNSMAKIDTVEVGAIALIQQTEDGRIRQIATTKEQSRMLQLFLATLSQESKLVQMPEEYDLVLKSSVCNKCQKNN